MGSDDEGMKGLGFVGFGLLFGLWFKSCNDGNALIRKACIENHLSKKECLDWEIR